MKTIKIIDLVILIANKEYDKLPKKIKYNNLIFKLETEYYNYINDSSEYYTELLEGVDGVCLNDEVEIIEEPTNNIEEIKELPFDAATSNELTEVEEFLIKNINILKNKLNEVIRKVNGENK